MTEKTSDYAFSTTNPFVLTLMTTPGPAARRIKNEHLPPAVQVDETQHREVVRYLGAGAETYDYNSGTGKFDYREPEAVLYDLDVATQRGIHFGGSDGAVQWLGTDGSKVVATVATYVDAPAPGDPTKDVEWVLAEAIQNFGDGVFSDVTFLQRVLTYGGQVPPSTIGTTVAVAYTALYIFWARW